MRSRLVRTRLCASLLGSAIHALAICGLILGDLGYVAAASAQEDETVASGETASQDAMATPAELEELVGPLALYPDELLAIALPASTYPLQIVQASRFLEKRETNPELQPDEEWDASILGLLNYPEALELMNDDLNWTWKLGEAVANQQDDVMAAVQSFRAKVEKAGNLKSDDKVTIVNKTEDDQQIIIIESTSTEVIYVPRYEPTTVVIYQSVPYRYYYSAPYPYYYHPRAAFWTGMFVGAAIGFGMSWGRHGHHRHGSININRNVNINVNRPGNKPGNRPGNRPGGGEAWKPDKGRGTQSGGRPGGDRASTARTSDRAARSGAGDSARSGSRNAASTRDRSQRSSSASRASTSDRGRQGTSSSRDRSSRGRDMTTRSSSRS